MSKQERGCDKNKGSLESNQGEEEDGKLLDNRPLCLISPENSGCEHTVAMVRDHELQDQSFQYTPDLLQGIIFL